MAWLSKLSPVSWLEAARWLGRSIISVPLLVIQRAYVLTVRDNVSDVVQRAVSESGDHHVDLSQQLVSVESGHTRLPSLLVQPLKFVQRCLRELRDCYRASSSVGDFFTCLWSNVNWRIAIYYGAVIFYCSVTIALVVKIIVIDYMPCHPKPKQEEPTPSLPINPGVEEFVAVHYPEYEKKLLSELGSRMKKEWIMLVKKSGTAELDKEPLLLTDAPVSQNCPLVLHEHQKGLNKLLNAIEEHPYIHPVEEVHYNAVHEKLYIVQPYRAEGSLKDLIYKVDRPTVDWSQKYAHRSKGLSPEKVAQFGRQILEAMQFLYSIGFPPIDHVQSGNIFVVDDVCLLGGYENTLLGYKTRIYRLCKDHLSHLDIILFGHLIFEMSGGYELTEVRPGADDYKAVPSAVRPILEYIFTDGFPHSIEAIAGHEFFDVPVEKFDPLTVHSQLSDSAIKTVLEKVRKNKPRVQKPVSAVESGIKATFSRIRIQWPRFFKVKRDHKNADQVSISSKQSFS